MKKIFTLFAICAFLTVQLSAQIINGYFQIKVTDLPGSATNRAIVQARAVNSILPQVSVCNDNDEFVTNIIGGMKFAVKWPAGSAMTNVNVGANNAPGACPDPGSNGGTEGHYSFQRGLTSPAIANNGSRVMPFFMNALTIPTPENWVFNHWITICTLNITQVAPGCTNCNEFQIVQLGDFPELEGSLDVDHTFALDQNGVGIALEYNMAPVNPPLPLNLLAFDAKKSGNNDALLTWTTSQEQNTSHFQIQRSYDKITWFDMGKVTAAGFSTEIQHYTFTDYQVYNGRDNHLQVYYRLNMVDADGQQQLSPIKSVLFGNTISTGKDFAVYPNPASDGLHVEWDANQVEQPTSLEFYDIAGKLVYSEKIPEQTNQQYVDFTKTQIHSGLYLMRVMSGDVAIEHKQIVVGQSR